MSSSAPDQAEIEVRFRYSYWDRLRSALVMSWQTPVGILGMLAAPLIVSVLLLVQLYRGFSIDAAGPALAALALGLTFPLLMQAVLTATVHFSRTHKGRIYRYRFGDFGLRALSETEEWTQSWKAILQVKQQGGFLLLFFSRNCAHCLPSRQVREALGPILSLARAHGVRVGES